MKHLVALFISVLIVQSSFAQTPVSAETLENIDSIIKLTQTDKILDTMFINMEKGMKEGMRAATNGKPLSSSQQAHVDSFGKELMDTMRSMLAYDKLKPLIVQAYTQTYTPNEIARIKKLQESDDAKMMNAKQAILSEHMNAATMKLIGPAVQAMTQRMQSLPASIPKE